MNTFLESVLKMDALFCCPFLERSVSENHYDVTIRETLEVKMKVAANSREEAEQFARDQRKRGEVVLDASHFTGVEFHAKRYSRDRGKR